MKILVISLYSFATPHFQTELELIEGHLEKSDEVYVLHCDSELKTCSYNPTKKLGNCYHCKVTFKKGFDILDKKNQIKFIPFLKEKQHNIDIKYDFEDIDELKKYKINGIDFGMAAASSITSQLRDHRFSTKKYRERVKVTLETSVNVYYTLEKYISELKPDIAYLFNGRPAELRAALRACQAKGVKIYTHERGATMYKYDLFEETTPHDFEYVQNEIERYWVNGSSDKTAISEDWYLKRRQGIEIDWISFIKDQKQDHLPNNFSKDKKNIGIFISSEDEFAAIEEIDMTSELYIEQTDAVKDIAEYFKDDNSIHFYLRVHPNLKAVDNSQVRDIKSLENMNFPNLTVIHAESVIDTYALIDNCDKIITFGSTTGLEAVIANKPSILVGNKWGNYYNKLDVVYMPASREEFFSLIKNKLEPKNRLGAHKYGYWAATHGFDHKNYQATSFTTGSYNNIVIDVNFSQLIIRKTLILGNIIKLLSNFGNQKTIFKIFSDRKNQKMIFGIIINKNEKFKTKFRNIFSLLVTSLNNSK